MFGCPLKTPTTKYIFACCLPKFICVQEECSEEDGIRGLAAGYRD